MYLSILFCNVYDNISQWLEYFFFIVHLLLIMTRLQTRDINKAFDLHSKFEHEVITLHQSHEKCSSKILRSKVLAFRPLHQIESKQDECEK